jgi:hypothetical protein
LPDWDGELFSIFENRITVKPYDGDTCDGATLAPDTIGSLRPVIGALFHDPWYLEMDAIARTWGWPVRRVRVLGDHIFYGILRHYAGPVAKAYYYPASAIGGVARWLYKIGILSLVCAMLGGCGGCIAPLDPFDPDAPFTDPDYDKTAATETARNDRANETQG